MVQFYFRLAILAPVTLACQIMNETDARLNILQSVARVLTDFALDDDPDADAAELEELFMDVADSIFDEVALEIVSVNGDIATVTMRLHG
jgi:hypothetical protein